MRRRLWRRLHVGSPLLDDALFLTEDRRGLAYAPHLKLLGDRELMATR
jgi:hypothetical protein